VPKNFAYKAKDRAGQVITGTFAADSEAAVAAFIREKGYFVTQIKPAADSGQATYRGMVHLFNPVGVRDLSLFCRQFATMIGAGLSFTTSLAVLADQTQNPRIREAVKDLLAKVTGGESLSRAMRDHPAVFPDIMVSMVEAGEVGGVLDIVLDRLASHFEKEHKLNAGVKSALTYPAVVLCFAGLVVVFILTFVMPRFVELFASLRVKLPAPTLALMAVSDFLQTYGLLLAALLLAAVYGLVLYVRRPRGRELFDMFVLHMPVFGRLMRTVAAARFCRTLSTLLHGGVPIITAIDAVKKTTGNQVMIKAITAAQAGVREGEGLAATLGASGVFPPMVVQMAAVGEETGELDKMLEKVADFYEGEVDDTIGRLSSLLQPILIGILGTVIGAIVVAVLLPIFNLVGNINTLQH
jgi:type IV pilus assembly protein PilC